MRVMASIGVLAAAVGTAAIGGEVADTRTLTLRAPIRSWDEAIPLGNGLTGGLLWGQDGTINLSLDRGDLWDERLPAIYRQENWNYDTIRTLKAAGNQGEISRLFDAPYRMPYPTKLPGGRLVLDLGPGPTAKSFALDMQTAVGRVDLGNGSLECFFSALRPVAMIRVPGRLESRRIVRPKGLDRLGYGPGQFGETGDVLWLVQDAAEGLQYAVVMAAKAAGDATELAVAITSNRDGADPLGIGRQRVAEGLKTGYDGMLRAHLTWWADFWAISSVSLPDERIQRHYNLVKYFYGAASRPDAPPMPLQAVWTRDDGGLPPWKGDFHHDLNTQMTYLPYHAAGLVDSGLSFVRFNWDLLGTYRDFARKFYGVEGAAVPAVSTLAGKPTGGWSQYALSPINALWIGQTFHLHWRYTMDREFLATRAYPWLSEVATAIVNLCDERDGKLYLPLSSSPEIHNNSLRAWLEPNSNYDLSLMRWGFAALAEMAAALEKHDEADGWRRRHGQLEALHVTSDDVLMFAKGEPFNGSHRHHSHTMAIHPLGNLNTDGSEDDRGVIQATLDRMDAKGTQAWTGYSFSWFSGILARAGRGEEAFRYLGIYEKAFTLRNGFHVNGDQLRAGFSGFTYRPFTLEGNFLAMDAVHEMLLQSWPPDILGDPTPVIRLFPAMPWLWHDASFDRLRAQGGYVVSARRERNATTWFRIRPTEDGVLRIRDNFGGRRPRFNRDDVRRAEDLFLVDLKAGDVLEAALPTPKSIPPEPENAARPFKLPGPIRPNRLPLRIGADSNGQNGFLGDIARASVYERVLTAEELTSLANHTGPLPHDTKGCVASWDFRGAAGDTFTSRGQNRFVARQVGHVDVIEAGATLGNAIRLDGSGYLTVDHDDVLNCPDGVTLEAWICPRVLPASGGRIIDKSPAGAATAYLLDTYPGNSLRLIFRDPHVSYAAQFKPGEWVHVAGTVDGRTGRAALYVNGKRVVQQ